MKNINRKELDSSLDESKNWRDFGDGAASYFQSPETMEGLTGEDAIWRNFLVQKIVMEAHDQS